MSHLFEVMERAAECWPNRTALVQNERIFTYRDLRNAVEEIATALTEYNIKPGDKVGIVFPRSIGYVIACFAVLKAGAIAVPISAAHKALEIAAAASMVDIDAFCCHQSLLSTLSSIAEPSTGFRRTPGYPEFVMMRLATASTNADMRERLLAAHTAYICFSSGTTSISKGIVLSHEALLERADRRTDTPKITQESCILWLRALDRFVPNQFIAAFMAGAKVIIGNSLNMGILPDLIRQHGVDQVWAVPAFYRALLQDSVTASAYAPVTHFLSSGAPVSLSLAQDFYNKFGHEIIQNYGSAECSPIFINSATDPEKRGSVGMPVDGREIRLRPLDATASESVSEGELLVRGMGMLTAYYNPWRSPEEFLEDGWLPTGDIARRDEDGFYWIVGRIKEVINVGGTKVFASEIEDILSKHPLVEDCVVFPARDPRFGEVPHAKVKLRDPVVAAENALLGYANERLSVFKSLRRLEVVDQIEKTVTGKPKRWLYRTVAILVSIAQSFFVETAQFFYSMWV
jgi:long-chain acyl-CoA synthetase